MRYPRQASRHSRKSAAIVECVAGAVKFGCVRYQTTRFATVYMLIDIDYSQCVVLSQYTQAFMEALVWTDRLSVEPNGSGVLVRLDCHIARTIFGFLSAVGHSASIPRVAVLRAHPWLRMTRTKN
jgi:hypothetical protein